MSVSELEQHLAGQSEAARRAYSNKVARKEFVDSVVRFELLAAEAERRGYARDPQVIRGMKQQMIARMLQDEAAQHPEAEVSADDITRHFEDHRDEFHKPAAASIRQIVLRDRTTADTVAAEAKSARKPDFMADQKAFEKVAASYAGGSGKSAGQQSGFFEERASPYPGPVTQAIFAMTELGELAGPVASEQGYHVIKLAGRRPEVIRSLDEVREQIRQRLLIDRRTKRSDEFVADLRKRIPVEINETALDQLQWGQGSATGPESHQR